ncbi:helix-turn-helix transcriptional regulator [uncultured Megasphaera sp.]|uniref:helix-turn-helix domain-containing protein n=1 Tax=uncultured Megasphaera sp. TaxID=165188 RepID=UPI0025D0D616|nr:helix-turn-helix transcriptional regulator [uncultured Megasphaera sp.]
MEWLKSFRNENGYTLDEMAGILGISKSLYEKIEYNDREPSRNFLTKFKKAFPDVDMNVFFT